MIGDLPTLGLGVALLAGGVDWRVRTVRRRREDFLRRARAALNDQAPATRRAAVAVVTQQGLSAVADLLLETIRQEKDRSVLDAIAEAVARNQWEPTHRREVFELRLWAQRRLELRAQQPHNEALGFYRRLMSPPSPRASDSHPTEGAARLHELIDRRR